MDASTVPRAIEPLIAQGWVRAETGADRRRKILSLTRSGRRKIDAAEMQWRVVQAGVVSQFGAEGWADMTKRLARLRASTNRKR
jgi:DNA-binding MarR family transcriptional regulator